MGVGVNSMKVLHINSMVLGSTGRIMQNIARISMERGIETCISYSEAEGKIGVDNLDLNMILIGNNVDFIGHHLLGRITGCNGCFSKIETNSFIGKVKSFNPDIIHIHNLHNCYINWKILFEYIKNENKFVVWTLHDCWAVTGNCVYFDFADCNRWKTECMQCPQLNNYPKAYKDRVKYLYNLKKKSFQNVKNMVIISPSVWLKNIVKQSYLSNYPIQVINNGIDLNIFKPTISEIRRKYHIEKKYIILGVARKWERRKGLDILIQLSGRLDNRFHIIIVGLERSNLNRNNNLTCIQSISNQKELAKIYSTADIFINPTREDNFPTVNIEALACGIPVATFNTGGSGEVITESNGYCIEKDDIEALVQVIMSDYANPKKTNFNQEECKKYDMNKKFDEYINLYQKIYSNIKE